MNNDNDNNNNGLSIYFVIRDAGLHYLWQPGSQAARKWRENEKMKRKWRENEENFFIFSLFSPSVSISRSKIVSFCRKMLNTALLSQMSQKN